MPVCSKQSFKQDDKHLEYVNIINSSGELLLKLINDIIDISKIEAGQFDINPYWFEINTMFDRLSDFFSELPGKKVNSEVSLVFELPYSSLPKGHRLYSDKLRIEQVLANLYSNAIKFTDKGEIKIGFSYKGGVLTFFVKDTGRGISKKEQSDIFARYKQANNQNKCSEGSGLGLSIASGIVRLLGGDIWVESKQNEGSAFYFTVPQLCGNDATTAPKHELATDFSQNGVYLIVSRKKVKLAKGQRLKKQIEFIYRDNLKAGYRLCNTDLRFDAVFIDQELINEKSTSLIERIQQKLYINKTYLFSHEELDANFPSCFEEIQLG
ncbi:MAG: hypothetical protein HC896_09875 [Bacteroidales bacterium]|nr:hypothetical protein [Bacteroidales bacterium]